MGSEMCIRDRLIALGIGKKINYCYLFIFCGSILIYADDSCSGIVMSCNVQVSRNLSEYYAMP